MQKHFRSSIREWLWIAAGALLLAAALLLPLGCALADSLSAEEQALQKAYEKNEIIRIHIVANSNSEQDQEIKFKVRDALIERFGHMLGSTHLLDADSVYQLLLQNTNKMLETAKQSAAQYGFSGPVSAETGLLDLPEKNYGKILLPAGRYRALRITLGEGKGQNWWCVLYPQLCLALSDEGTKSEDELYWITQRIFQQWLLLK